MNQFSELSIKLTKKLSKDVKQSSGIYFTPYSIIEKNFELLEKYGIMNQVETILEPSCGSGQYIDYIKENYRNVIPKNIIGIELNNDIFKEISELYSCDSKIVILNQNFLEFSPETKYDLIIGNPPYFVVSKKYIDNLLCKMNLKEYSIFYEGRPNIFILFIIHSISLLKDNGVLSFILPKSFLNCLYYNPIREFIYKNFMILNIYDCSNDKYLETEQDTIIFIMMKTKDNENYNDYWSLYFNKESTLNSSSESYIIFNTYENILKIKELIKESTTLHKLNFNVKVGNIVWNQHKDILTKDDTQTLLIYNSNIVNNSLKIIEFNNDEKKPYISKKGNIGPILVLNRGYGRGDYKFNYCLIDINKEYLIENHLICITPEKEYEDCQFSKLDFSKLDFSKLNLLEKYNKIIDSLNDERTLEFIKLYFGNNAINTSEIKFILPIYI